jgi:hypothetical protein
MSVCGEIETAESLIKSLTNQYDYLIEQHGRGVRPSWVSEELSHLGMRIQDANARLALLLNGNKVEY